MLVNGQGGIGKTTFAAKYWDKYQHKYSHLAFLFVENGIANALLSLAPVLKLEFNTETLEQQLVLLVQKVSNLQKPCLLILDNANKEQDLNENIMVLRRCSNFHILLTSRLADFEYAQKYPLGTLKEEKALEVFRIHYPLLEEAEIPLFQEIYTAVGGNTLVLELMAKNLSNFNNKLKKRYALQDLKNDLQKGLTKLSQSKEVNTTYQARGTGLRHETPEAIILAMYDLTDLTEAETALLSVFAVLPAENIESDTLTTLLQNDNLDTPLLTLAQKGWLEQSDTSFKTNPVIQEITLHKNQERLFQDCTPLITQLTKLLSAEEDQYYLNFKWLPYTQKIRALFAEKSELSDFNNNLALVLQALGGEENLRQAEGLLEKALANNIANFGEKAPSVAVRQSNLALVLKDLGGEENLRQAKELLKKALATCYTQMGEQHYYTQIVLDNLFGLYIEVHTGKPWLQCTEEEVSALIPGFWDWVRDF
ncbi:MAG: hypothetical protein OHK0053_03140 [Microscillaceae bacterium]